MFFELLGTVLCLIGAWLVSDVKSHMRAKGFAVLLLSHMSFICWACCVGAWFILAMNIVFLYTSSRGLFNCKDTK